jgi:hypothetical protein
MRSSTSLTLLCQHHLRHHLTTGRRNHQRPRCRQLLHLAPALRPLVFPAHPHLPMMSSLCPLLGLWLSKSNTTPATPTQSPFLLLASLPPPLFRPSTTSMLTLIRSGTAGNSTRSSASAHQVRLPSTRQGPSQSPLPALLRRASRPVSASLRLSSTLPTLARRLTAMSAGPTTGEAAAVLPLFGIRHHPLFLPFLSNSVATAPLALLSAAHLPAPACPLTSLRLMMRMNMQQATLSTTTPAHGSTA